MAKTSRRGLLRSPFLLDQIAGLLLLPSLIIFSVKQQGADCSLVSQ